MVITYENKHCYYTYQPEGEDPERRPYNYQLI